MLALSMHLVCLPLAFIHILTGPDILSVPTDVILTKLSGVERSVRPEKFATALLQPVKILSFVLTLVWPCFYACPTFDSFPILALIDVAIYALITTRPVKFVGQPITLVQVSIGINEPAQPDGLVSRPLALMN